MISTQWYFGRDPGVLVVVPTIIINLPRLIKPIIPPYLMRTMFIRVTWGLWMARVFIHWGRLLPNNWAKRWNQDGSLKPDIEETKT